MDAIDPWRARVYARHMTASQDTSGDAPQDGEGAGDSADRPALSAREAADFLGVKLPTLYAYASRGLVRSLPGATGRARSYLREDLEELRERRGGRGAAPASSGSPALRFGEPVLDTRITAIHPERGPLYRGHSALVLAEAGEPFERVAELLWGGALPAEGDLPRWSAHDFPFPLPPLRRVCPREGMPIETLQVVVPLLASRDPGRFADGREVHRPRVRALIRRMAAALVPGLEDARVEAAFAAPTLAASLGHALAARRGAEGVRALDAALVLCADHELNASAFAARVAASTGADLYACVSAALAALCGPRHGGAVDRVAALVAEIGRPEAAERVVHERARRGETVEGFVHPLYPNGDPRGAALVAAARELAPKATAVRTCIALCDAMASAGASGPSLDVGLVALGAALGLPPGGATAVFAIGRTAGWVAHALEQAEEGGLLRPRARYVGPPADRG